MFHPQQTVDIPNKCVKSSSYISYKGLKSEQTLDQERHLSKSMEQRWSFAVLKSRFIKTGKHQTQGG